MPAERYYIPALFSVGDTKEITDKELHHFLNVMRGTEGQTIELVNGMGQLAQGNVIAIKKKIAEVRIDDVFHAPPPETEIVLAQAIPRLNRLDFILEKGTELGMTALWLFPGEQGERREISEHQIERMQAQTIAAMKQSGRLYLPSISLKPKIDQWKPVTDATLFYGDVNTGAPSIGEVIDRIPRLGSLIFVIGPESGLSKKEIESLRKINAYGVTLHRNILRTDTAALAALTLLEYLIRK